MVKESARIDRIRVGLDKVPNKAPATMESITYLDNKIDSHTEDLANPHQTTPALIGMTNKGSVTNAGADGPEEEVILSGKISDSDQTNRRDTIPSTVPVYQLRTDLGELEANFDSHTIDYNNPHQVTKAQVGLGNIPNLTSKQVPVGGVYDSPALADPNVLATTLLTSRINSTLGSHTGNASIHKVLTNLPNETSATGSNEDNPTLNNPSILATTALTRKIYELAITRWAQNESTTLVTAGTLTNLLDIAYAGSYLALIQFSFRIYTSSENKEIEVSDDQGHSYGVYLVEEVNKQISIVVRKIFVLNATSLLTMRIQSISGAGTKLVVAYRTLTITKL